MLTRTDRDARRFLADRLARRRRRPGGIERSIAVVLALVGVAVWALVEAV